MTALDNVDARRYVDEACVRHSLSLLDSGTLGVKGNSQVILPYITESYGSSSGKSELSLSLSLSLSLRLRVVISTLLAFYVMWSGA